ncbi:MAG: class I SAM-dependent methyltransferase [Chloroflexi bacterium]|nr:class I SAM-dependent methyltransferase [Chloroflexota bacterium]MBP8059062.1 class I SAM-dependent methyltransferase [Chloroflexota bacterium]
MLSLDQQNVFREEVRRRQPGWRPATEVYAEMVKTHLRPQSHLLDLGCGRGGLVEQLAHPLTQSVGVDPDWLSLKEHRLELPRAAAFSHALPFVASQFDLIFASWVLEHLPHPQADLAEVARVLKPGGVFIFITPNRRHPLIQLNRWLSRFSRLQDGLVQKLYGRAAADTFKPYYHANSATDLQNLAQQSGLTLNALHPIMDPTYLAFTPLLFRLMLALEKRLSPSRYIHLVGMMSTANPWPTIL